MNKRGFTFIELIAVITLLGVITFITFPVVNDLINDSKQKLYDEQIKQIENSLKSWASSNVFLLPEDDDTITLSLGQLKQSGHSEIKIKNPKSNKCFSNESLLTISKYNNNYVYDTSGLFDTSCESIENSPIISLKGSAVEYLNIGDIYVEQGAVARTSTGTDISSNVTTIVSGSYASINTNVSGSYIITYSVTDDEKTMIAIRNVFVR